MLGNKWEYSILCNLPIESSVHIAHSEAGAVLVLAVLAVQDVSLNRLDEEQLLPLAEHELGRGLALLPLLAEALPVQEGDGDVESLHQLLLGGLVHHDDCLAMEVERADPQALLLPDNVDHDHDQDQDEDLTMLMRMAVSSSLLVTNSA